MPAKTNPPGPKYLPFMGIDLVRRLQRDPLAFSIEMHAKYGETLYYRCGSIEIYHFLHPDHVQQVLVRNAKSFYKPPQVKRVMRKWDGEGLLLSEGDFWARQRRLVQGAFHPRRIREYVSTFADRAARMTDRWQDRAEIDVAAETMRVTLDVVGETFFGKDLGSGAQKIADAANTLQETAMIDFGRIIPVPTWVPTRHNRRTNRAIRVLNELIDGIIAERRASKEDRGDLLSMLLLAVDDTEGGQGMTDRQARDEATTLLLAGHETTAVALTWALYLLARHPAIQDRIADQVGAALGGRAPTADDLPRLEPVEAALKEAMRLYPPAYLFGREAVAPVEIAGYTIRPGAQVNVIPYLTQRDPRWFEAPDEFRPERFENDGESRLRPLSYFPFGAGPRACIGKQMAMIEGTVVLTCILQQYRLSLAPGQGEVQTEAQISLHPKGKLRLAISPRSAAMAQSVHANA